MSNEAGAPADDVEEGLTPSKDRIAPPKTPPPQSPSPRKAAAAPEVLTHTVTLIVPTLDPSSITISS